MALIHDELRTSARVLPRNLVGPRFVRVSRWMLALRGVPAPPRCADVAVHDVWVDVPQAPRVRVRIYRPSLSASTSPTTAPRASLRPALLWLHGGGFVIGTPEQDESGSIALVRELGVVVAAVDYRLAPEHPHPAALHDAWAAVRMLQRDAAALGIRADRIAVGGMSAGAGLAAAVVHRARDEGLPLAFQLLIYPMLDDRTIARSDVDPRSHRVWSTTSNAYAWRAYAGPHAGARDAQIDAGAAPARRADLRGLPPTWIGVGTCDLFHDEDVHYAARLREAEVPVDLVVVQGAYHGFDVVRPSTTVARTFRASWTDALRAALS